MDRVASWIRTTRRRTTRYHRRRPVPAIAVLTVLVVGVGVVWITVLISSAQDSATDCNPPTTSDGSSAAAAAGGQVVGPDALDETAPIPAAGVHLQVLNATTQRGEAAIVTTTLQQAGFTQVAAPANDPLYPKRDLQCRGQIRFGPDGAAAARTLSLVEPCMQLVRDNRQDGGVDLALGDRYTGGPPSPEATKILGDLASWAASHPRQVQPKDSPPLNPELLGAARDTQCD